MTELPSPPAAPPPKAPRDPERRRISPLELIGLIVGILGLVIGVLEILPDDMRAGLFGGAPTATPIAPPTPVSFADDEIGILISRFVTPADQPIEDAEMARLMDGVYQRLAAELDTFRDQLDVAVQVRPPSQTAFVPGSTRAERERNASLIAAQTGAEIVLYGEVTRAANGTYEVQPEFYIAPDLFSDALELTGAYRLGGDVAVALPVDVEANALLTGRTQVAAQIFAGLVFYLGEEYRRALAAFQQAAAQPGWEQTEGREVLSILIGNTYNRLASLDAQAGEIDAAREHLAATTAQYQAALATNPEYARGYNGMASAGYLEWNLNRQADPAAPQDALLAALDWLERGEEAIDQPEELAVRTKPLYTRILIHYALWTFYIDVYTGEQLATFERAIQRDGEQILRRYDDGGYPPLQEFASEVYANRGLMLYSQSRCPEAVEQFTLAVELAPGAIRRMFFNGWLGDCYALMNQPEAAISAYFAAVEAADSLDSPPLDQIARYESRIDELRSNG
ncbi:MAG: hypothetical protein SF162_12575 [bacterium]|nr:hypothetical protein [bacterium]